jgi:hypothetical protein
VIDRLAAVIVDESKWLTASMGLALIAAAILLYRHRHSALSHRRRIMATMNLFFGVTIGTMAVGHLLAVTTKLAVGTLEGSTVVFYAIGVLLAVPSFRLTHLARKTLSSEGDHGRTTILTNVWLAITLLALGIHNLPLAAPAFFNIGYHLHSRRVVGWAIVGMAVAVGVGLFIGSLIFLASGQSFEQFRGME